MSEEKLLNKIELLNNKLEAKTATRSKLELFDYLCLLWCELYN
jgi:hypothetical protein